MKPSKRKARRKRRVRGVRFTERELRPYTIALGQLALAWNAFHEQLAAIFYLLTDRQLSTPDGDDLDQRPISLWNSAKFDRQKREMLKAVVSTLTDEQAEAFPKLRGEIEWIMSRADALEDARNDAIHSPLFAVGIESLGESIFGHTLVMPDLMYGNLRSIKLSQRELLPEYRWCRNATLELRDYVSLIHNSLSLGVGLCPWPDRPSLPNRAPKKIRRSAQSHPETK
jgi:hypothetical protein